MSADDNVATVRSIYDAFNRGDLEAAAAHAAHDFELVDFAGGMTLRGPEGFRQWLEVFRTAFPDARVQLTTEVAAGDWVATEHVGRGTFTGPLVSPSGEVPPTGRSFELQVAEFFRLREGRLVELHTYHDLAGLMRQLGVQPAPEGAAI